MKLYTLAEKERDFFNDRNNQALTNISIRQMRIRGARCPLEVYFELTTIEALNFASREDVQQFAALFIASMVIFRSRQAVDLSDDDKWPVASSG